MFGVSGTLTPLFCWSWLAYTDRATLSAIVYFEWSPPKPANPFVVSDKIEHTERNIVALPSSPYCTFSAGKFCGTSVYISEASECQD